MQHLQPSLGPDLRATVRAHSKKWIRRVRSVRRKTFAKVQQELKPRLRETWLAPC